MNVALILSGQPRFTNNQNTFDSHKRNILWKYKTDVFCHCWYDPSQLTQPASNWSTLPNAVIQPNAVNRILAEYNPVCMDWEPPKKFEFSAKIKTLLEEKFKGQEGWTDQHYSNILSSLYSIQRAALELIQRDYMQYDFIILSRYDNFIYKMPDLETLEKGKFYVSDHHDRMPDLFFIFDPKFFSFLALFHNAERLIEKYIDRMWGPSLNEPIKMFNFLDRFGSFDDLVPIPLPVRVVRDDFNKGDTNQLERYNLTAQDGYVCR